MKGAAVTAAVLLSLSCAPAGGPGETGGTSAEGIDASRDRYLAETFLDGPRAGSTSEAGAGIETDGSGKCERREAWVRFGARGIAGAGRLRVTGGLSREAYHISAVPAGRLRIDLGDLVPDIGIGLISSGRRFAYPFSSNHPLYRPRGIRGWTGFYGSFIRGASVYLAAGPARLTLISGRGARHGGRGVEYCGGGDVSGFRIEAGTGGITVGMTAMDAGSRHGEGIAGADLAYSSGGRRFMIEAARSHSGNVSAAWGILLDGKKIDCGMIGWSVPARSDGFLASFPGLSAAKDRHRSGASITLRKRLPRRTYLSAWGELRRSSDGDDRELGRSLRLEAGIRWRGSGARCSWSSRVKGSEKLVPYPPAHGTDRDASGGLVAAFSCSPASCLDMTMELKRPVSDGGEGLLVAARATLELRRIRSRISLSAASYRSMRGRARFSLYEPSGAGSYPWKTLFGRGDRLSLGLDVKTGRMKASLRLLWGPGGGNAAAVRLTAFI